jgi:hypothetical protein
VVLDKTNGIDLYTGRTAIYRIKMNFTDPDSLTKIWKWSPQIAGAPGSPKSWYYGDVETISLGARDANGRPMIWTGTINNGARNLYRTALDLSLAADSMPRWVRADASGLPTLFPSWLHASHRDSLVAFASFSGFGTTGHIFRTGDGGKTWKNISGNLPNAPIDAFVVDTLAEHGDSLKRGQCIIAAMDVGVFITTNGGNSWSQLGTGMPNLVVGTISMYRNWVVVGTHGRSAWAIDVSNIDAVEDVKPEVIAQTNTLSVYPNPATSVLHVQLTNSGKTSLELFDLKGTSVLRTQTSNDRADITLPAHLASGTYVLRAINSNGDAAEAKVIVSEP